MGSVLVVDWQNLLESINVVLTSGIVIVSSALLLYLVIYSARNGVARSFAALLACVLAAYFVDLALVGVEDADAGNSWLRFQWVGIAFTPAAYLSFSNAVLTTTGAKSRLRDIAIRLSYLLSAVVLLFVTFSDVVVGGVSMTGVPHLLPKQPFFSFFVVYFIACVGWGAANVRWAYRRCLTSTSQRRMIYLAATFAAPAAGVFPYVLLTNSPAFTSRLAFWLLLVLGNVSVGLMLVPLSYSVAFFGALVPDRAVKHRMVRFLLRGPLLATLVVVVMVAASQAEGWLGLPNHRVMVFSVVGAILLIQLGIELVKPLIDRALYRQEYSEITRIQGLSDRVLTATDLHQFLDNILTALCDLLRVETAFVVSVDNGVPHLEVFCGTLSPDMADDLPPEAWQAPAAGVDATSERQVERYGDLFVWDGYWLAPLRVKGQDIVVGVVGIAARAPSPDLNPGEQEGIKALLAQAAMALDDRQLLHRVYDVLEHIIPEIEDIQRRGGVVHYVGERALSGFSLTEDTGFRQWVRDALSHYWGGPKLMASPLMSLHVVERAAREHGGNVMWGLRAVLKQAIERLRPDGQRQMTTPEWILYNILELKFLQGRRVREIAMRLAMSESDLYRKQRIAIEAVAQALAEMEQAELSNQ